MPVMNLGAVATAVAEADGVRFYHIPSNKFKTVRIDILYAAELDEKKVSAYALVPYLLKRGSVNYPSQQLLRKRMEELYGASLGAAVAKDGDAQVLYFSMTSVAEKFTSGDEDLFRESMRLFIEILKEPMMVDGMFPADVFIQEKENLCNSINSHVNNKLQYAMLRCIEEMCSGEAFSVSAKGCAATAAAVTNEAVVTAHKHMITSLPCHVYISGELSNEDIDWFVQGFVAIRRKDILPLPNTKDGMAPETIRVVEEEMDISQAKLCMGYRTHTPYNSSDYPALMVYNGILGGEFHSKLFQNVREKASLAYYAVSSLERAKQLMFIDCGIKAVNREAVEKIIEEQLKDMVVGNISDDEIDATVRSLNNTLRMACDNQMSVAMFHYGKQLVGSEESFDGLMCCINKVTREDVMRVAARIQPDTVFFLKPEIESENGCAGSALDI